MVNLLRKVCNDFKFAIIGMRKEINLLDTNKYVVKYRRFLIADLFIYLENNFIFLYCGKKKLMAFV